MIKKLIWAMVIFWLALIFYFSHQSGEASRETSGNILAKAKLIQQEEATTISDSAVLKLQRIIRKWAHFIVYFALGVLVTLSIITIKYMYYKSYLFAWLFSSLYGLSDEIHQYFVPGRGAMLSDVMLDAVSALAGVFIVMIVVEILRYRDSRLLKVVGVEY